MKKKNLLSKGTDKLKEGMAQKLDLPKDILLGAAIVTLTGQSEAYVENYRGILEYTSSRIRLLTKTCRLEIAGKNLLVVYYTNDEMKITGTICEVKYDA